MPFRKIPIVNCCEIRLKLKPVNEFLSREDGTFKDYLLVWFATIFWPQGYVGQMGEMSGFFYVPLLERLFKPASTTVVCSAPWLNAIYDTRTQKGKRPLVNWEI